VAVMVAFSWGDGGFLRGADGAVVVVAVKRGSAVEPKPHQSTHNPPLAERVRRTKSAQAC
jgi:hypothetical protein